MQEFLALVYDAVISKATETELTSANPSKTTQYHIKRSRTRVVTISVPPDVLFAGRNLRVLFRFKPVASRDHLVIPQHVSGHMT